jgi:hypothetical protein
MPAPSTNSDTSAATSFTAAPPAGQLHRKVVPSVSLWMCYAPRLCQSHRQRRGFERPPWLIQNRCRA